MATTFKNPLSRFHMHLQELGVVHPDAIIWPRIPPHRKGQKPLKGCLKSGPRNVFAPTKAARFSNREASCIITDEPYYPNMRTKKQWEADTKEDQAERLVLLLQKATLEPPQWVKCHDMLMDTPMFGIEEKQDIEAARLIMAELELEEQLELARVNRLLLEKHAGGRKAKGKKLEDLKRHNLESPPKSYQRGTSHRRGRQQNLTPA